MAQQTTGPDWEQELARWVTPFLQALGHKARRRWAPVYLQGLLGPGERKSVQPMAARVAPDDHEQLHHFIATSAWAPAPLEAALVREAQRRVGGPSRSASPGSTARRWASGPIARPWSHSRWPGGKSRCR